MFNVYSAPSEAELSCQIAYYKLRDFDISALLAVYSSRETAPSTIGRDVLNQHKRTHFFGDYERPGVTEVRLLNNHSHLSFNLPSAHPVGD